jgi:hypothetical protein
MNPFHKWEVFNMPLIAYRHDSYRNEERSRSLRLLVAAHASVWAAGAALASGEERQIFHTATPVTVMPSWKPHCRDIQIAVADAGRAILVLRWEAKVSYRQSSLETLLDDSPFWGTLFSGKRPCIKASHHERLIFREVDHRTNAERADEM